MIGKNNDKKSLPIGHSFFDEIIENGIYYVDKTLFVKDIIDKDAKVLLCTRPRRFGKTLNQTMLKCFFEDTAPIGGKDTRSLFRGLKIEAAGERYMERQGKYPVIFVSLKDARVGSFDGSYNHLRYCIADEFQRHAYVVEKISGEDRNLFKRLSNRTGSIDDYRESLRFLCKCLEEYHGNKAVILIDEYDVPLENAWSRGFYQEMIDFIRPFLSRAFKDNPHLQFSVITGCLRISKESIFTGLNHLEVISILKNDYSEYFGFTQNEIDAILSYYEIDGKAQVLRDWYNGYLFGDTEVYNPWSSLNVVSSWVTRIDEYPQPYWANTSGNAIIREMIDKMSAEAKADLETLVSGGTISVVVHEDVTFDEVYKEADNLWNFLFFTGYLKKVGESVDSRGRKVVEMGIPNREVEIIFYDKIREWFRDSIAEKNLDAFYNAILSGDAETFQSELLKLLEDSISFMDSAENFYHGFMVGLLSNSDRYRVKSNRESGHGRSDLVFYSANGVDFKAVIFELKIAPSVKTLPTACEEALKQIEDNNYAAYWDEEGYDEIIKYGIGFYKKRCRVLKG